MPTQKLLPWESSSPPSQPPTAFNIKIPLDIQQKLIKLNTKLTIIVSNGELSLKINDQLYKLNQFQEFSKIDLYKQFSASTFKSIGSINSKLTISSTPQLPQAQTPTNELQKPIKSHTPPIHSLPRKTGSTLIASGTKISAITKKLVHLLALGPIAIEEMCKRTKVSKNDVESVLRSISMVYKPVSQKVIKKYPHERRGDENVDLYVLNYSNYKELKLNDWKYSVEELNQIKENCALVFDHLNYSKNHPARLSLDSKKKVKKVDIETTPEPKLRKPEVVIKKISPPPINIPKLDDYKKRKRQPDHDEEYLKNLAIRFKSKYKEYESLYRELTTSAQDKKKKKKTDLEIELKKLYEMHKDLELWKKQLWNSVK